MSSMSEIVDSLPLSTWLTGIEGTITMYKKESIPLMPVVREFVRGMHVRGLVHHWEDCPLDCLAGKITEDQGIRIGKIEEQLMCEEMFTIAMELIDPVATPILAEQMNVLPSSEPHSIMVHDCHCNIKGLATWGCKCGGK